MPLFLIAYIKKLSPTTPTYFDAYTQKNYLLFLIYLFCEQCTELYFFYANGALQKFCNSPIIDNLSIFYIEFIQYKCSTDKFNLFPCRQVCSLVYFLYLLCNFRCTEILHYLLVICIVLIFSSCNYNIDIRVFTSPFHLL